MSDVRDGIRSEDDKVVRHIRSRDASIPERALPLLPGCAQFLPILAKHVVVQADARLADLEAGRPDDDVDVVLLAVGRFEPGRRHARDGRGGEGHVGLVQRGEPAAIVSHTLAVHRCAGNRKNVSYNRDRPAERWPSPYGTLGSTRRDIRRASSFSCSQPHPVSQGPY